MHKFNENWVTFVFNCRFKIDILIKLISCNDFLVINQSSKYSFNDIHLPDKHFADKVNVIASAI